MAATRYHVSRFGERWTVIRDETEIAAFALRLSAVAVAVRAARRDPPSHVFIHHPDGSIERDWRFGE